MKSVMTKRKEVREIPELGTLVRENDASVYQFCYYMTLGSEQVETLVFDVFRKFGNEYRKLASKKSVLWGARALRLRLFQIAWDEIRESLSSVQYDIRLGRDTRALKLAEEDLLGECVGLADSGPEVEKFAERAFFRLAKVEPEFRAPLILKDMLGFDDEEVTRVISIRWGVYRHRLHRGRIEYVESLRGQVQQKSSRASVEIETQTGTPARF